MQKDTQKLVRTARQLLEGKPRGLVAVRPDDSVLAALRLMAERDIGAVLVMDGGRLLGIFTERDHARRVEVQGKTAASTAVREVMTEKIVFVRLTETVDHCVALMKRMRLRHLPVMDGDSVVGVLSSRDVLEQLVSDEEKLIRELQQDRLYFTTTAGYY